MANYFIKSKNTNASQEVKTFLTENNVKFREDQESGCIEFSERQPYNVRVSILKKCDSLKSTIYDGKPKKNEANAVLSFLF